MWRLKSAILFLIMCSSFRAFSQVSRIESREFINYASGCFKETKFIDSNALYTTVVQIIVDKKNLNNTQVTVTNSISKEIMSAIDSLKKFNFKSLMGNHDRVSFQFPIAISIISSKSDGNAIEVDLLADKIAKLYHYQTLDSKGNHITLLSPLILTHSLKVYD